MIFNPTIVKQSGGSAAYGITDNTALGFPASAEAGGLVFSGKYVSDGTVYAISDAAGNSIPYKEKKSGFMYCAYFVMPASDVTVDVSA